MDNASIVFEWGATISVVMIGLAVGISVLGFAIKKIFKKENKNEKNNVN